LPYRNLLSVHVCNPEKQTWRSGEDNRSLTELRHP